MYRKQITDLHLIGIEVTSNSCQVKQAQLFIPPIHSPDIQVKLRLIRMVSDDFDYASLGEMNHFHIISENETKRWNGPICVGMI